MSIHIIHLHRWRWSETSANTKTIWNQKMQRKEKKKNVDLCQFSIPLTKWDFIFKHIGAHPTTTRNPWKSKCDIDEPYFTFRRVRFNIISFKQMSIYFMMPSWWKGRQRWGGTVQHRIVNHAYDIKSQIVHNIRPFDIFSLISFDFEYDHPTRPTRLLAHPATTQHTTKQIEVKRIWQIKDLSLALPNQKFDTDEIFYWAYSFLVAYTPAAISPYTHTPYLLPNYVCDLCVQDEVFLYQSQSILLRRSFVNKKKKLKKFSMRRRKTTTTTDFFFIQTLGIGCYLPIQYLFIHARTTHIHVEGQPIQAFARVLTLRMDVRLLHKTGIVSQLVRFYCPPPTLLSYHLKSKSAPNAYDNIYPELLDAMNELHHSNMI